jgi:hypothetical protein
MDKPDASPAATACPNCGTLGDDRFCARCGQRRDVHLHSVGHFIGEAAEVLTHADSSLWRTFVPLLANPGFLTREFLAGRRARYLQPFRLYLIASVLFFLVGSWSGNEPDFITAKPAATPAAATPAAATPAAATPAAAPAAAGAAPAQAPTQGAQEYTGKAACEHNNLEGTALARLAPRMRAACESVVADGGREFARSIYHNLGRAMFVFVPLLAAFMKLLYWRPKRWYLEHLLLLLHNHAAAFVAMTLLTLLELIVKPPGLQGLLRFGLAAYLAWYVFRSMRTSYGQGRLATTLKFMLVGCAYVVAAALMLGLTAAYSALTL